MKVKIELKELEKALDKIKKDTLDYNLTVETEAQSVKLRFEDREHKLVVIEIYDVATRATANITKTEKL